MRLWNSAGSWGWPARALHWAMAAIMVFMLGLGVYMAEIVSDVFRQFALTQLHKSWGFVVFALACLRVVWRLANPARPADPPGAPRWEAAAARAAHFAFYCLMFALPLSGWLYATTAELQDQYGIKNMVFGLFELPDFFVPAEGVSDPWFHALAPIVHTVHVGCAIALATLLALHVAAALKHHFRDRDDVLRRMSWGP